MCSIDQKELYRLLRESVKANTTNAAAAKASVAVQKEIQKNMCDLNDNFALHNRDAKIVSRDIEFIRKDLIRWMKRLLLIVFALLGGIIIAKAFGLDILNLVRSIGS